MAANAVGEPAIAESDRDSAPYPESEHAPSGEEAREASGLTTRLLLTYVERAGGLEAVDALLECCGLSDCEQRLRDENAWFPDSTRVALFEGATVVLDDPLAVRHAGEAAIDLNVGQALKLALRALGSPRLIYSNIVRANAKFNRVHRMEAIELGDGRARIRNAPLPGVPYHDVDCQYNVGLLSCVPVLFGRPPARVRHRTCIGLGAEECIYEIEWRAGSGTHSAVAAGAVGAGALAAAVLAAPGLIPLAAGAAVGATALAIWRTVRSRRRRWALLEAQVSEQAEVAERLTVSLQDLVSALRLDEVLAKVARNAQAALGGVEFALLVEEGGTLRCRGASEIPPESVAALKSWAQANAVDLERVVTVDDLAKVPELRPLCTHSALPLGSLCAAPVVYRERPLGTLVALAHGVESFLPADIRVLDSYAAQVAIALSNARLYEAQQQLAARDPLTGLLNHREFHETLARELERCRRHAGELSVVLIDLDDFKLVNDTAGHAEGDAVLRRVASALADSSRASDTVFRIGGDEFALVLTESGIAGAESAAKRVHAAIEALGNHPTVSCGIAAWPEAGPTKDALLARADAALYAAKGNGSATRAAPRSQRSHPRVPAGARQREQLASASRIAAKLAPLHDPIEIAHAAAADLDSAFGDFVAVISRLDPTGALVPVVHSQPVEHGLTDAEAWQRSIGGVVSARAARIGEPVVVSDPERDPELLDAGLASDEGSDLAVPIRVGGEVWGVLALERPKRHGFDSDDVLFIDMIGATVGAAIHRSELFGELEDTFMRTLAVLSDALEAKDSYTAAHARRVAELASKTGFSIGMDAEELRNLSYGALLHDIGKIGISDQILSKPDRLTAEEFEEVKRHSVIGADLVSRIPYFASVQPLVRAAHERWDGRGYPDGLAGEEIPLGARIIGACDAFHAMTSDRSYRRAMPVADAVAELREHAGTQFDATVVAVLTDLIGEQERQQDAFATGPLSG